MPTAHRVACFRDDIVFVVYLYQRWLVFDKVICASFREFLFLRFWLILAKFAKLCTRETTSSPELVKA